ncbi:MAG: homoserine dehydrogenase [Actinobacteria bacterium]|nr:homoserine dehydrogenase [Actinomycetota bacterium]MCG2818390.1 homoserine dehydrogenase [Actinomycetes bacterium]MBU4219985.1 homoserine dehydrogenase [Actinomycetota bacterium]MBU4358331.1 homoserine dehydrogenase [Actinomycetota bacterium]MBU4392788.1 homoserine dehydrogenase [Actinomycetota bacterium]
MADSGEHANIGLLGCGTIGSGVFHLVGKNERLLTMAAGRPLRISRILVKQIDEPRPFPVDRSLLTTDATAVLQDPGIDVFIELIGGIEQARSFALDVLGRGKHLVTANKELIACHGRELMEEAARSGSQVRFEASVGGGIPLIRPLEESLGGDRVQKIMGIVNGTTNYILTRMSDEGSTYAEALAGAQELGFAEADPGADVEGADAASKLAILCSIAFNTGVTDTQVYREGIQGVRPEDLENAREMGYAIKLLAVAISEDDGISARVHPTMIPLEHPLASVSGNFNAIFVTGESVGDLMFYGQGAGSLPTATAVLGDVVNIVRNMDRPPTSRRSYWSRAANVKSIDDALTRFYMVLRVLDRPGVLAQIAGVFGDNQVSLESVVQKGFGDNAQIVMITHQVTERNFQEARKRLESLDVVLEIPSVIRVESE